MCLIFFINIYNDKVISSFSVQWKFSSLSWIKINTDGVATGSLDLATCDDIFRKSMREFIGDFYTFLFWLLSYMKLYMFLSKFKRWVLLVYDLNVILPWFVIGGTLVLITVRKIRFRVPHIFRE